MKKITTTLLLCMAILFSFSQSVTLNLKAYIEGPYYNGQMTPFLNVLGYLPTSQPYNTSPWNYPGNESVTSFPSSNIVDWVLVDVLEPHTVGNQTKFEVVGRKAGFLFKTGSIKDIDGISNLIVQSNISSGFYVRVHHRNHLSVISAVPLVESGGVFTYDFTFPADQAMGGSLSQKQLSSVIWGMIAADANASGQIDNRDKNDVWLPQQNLTGYYEGDFNMDTQVDMDDKVVKWEPNAGKSSYSVKDTVVTPITWNCGDTIVDARDGQTYNTVQIGQQCWMAENLNVGTMIQGTNDMANNGVIEKYCFGNNNSNCETYGGLYQWDEIMEYTEQEGVQGICPTGWHMPADNEWCTLTQFIDPTVDCNIDGWSGTDVGIKIKSTTGWISGNGTNTSGFSALPGGYRSYIGGFDLLGYGANFWTSTISTNFAWDRLVGYDHNNIYRSFYGKNIGFSVRCLKDIPPPTWSCGDPLNDTRDGQTYNTVQIGEQCWMAENLNIGTMISAASDMADNSVIEKYCYNNNLANCGVYGGLYQWNEMMQYSSTAGSQGICPENWHLPTHEEWCTLTQYMDPTVDCNFYGWSGTDVGTKMKSTTGWDLNGNGTDIFGFKALPGGFRSYVGATGQWLTWGRFWSSSEHDATLSWGRDITSNHSDISHAYLSKIDGFSVRCVKDTPPPTWSCSDPLNDTRDGQIYNTVQIGDQCWMAENLNIGSMVTGATEMTNNSIIEKYCYNDDEANCNTYGGLFQWDEMMEYNELEGSQGICPTGWHLPSDTEWCTLTQFIDPTDQCGVGWGSGTSVGLKMKSTSGWTSNGNGTNESGFNVLPGGVRHYNINFYFNFNYAYLWSSTEEDNTHAFYRLLGYDNDNVFRSTNFKNTGMSVRCLKDTPPPTWSCGDPLNDTRDGQSYSTVQIGEQCWMAENLNIGTMIPAANEMTNNSVIERYCYNDDEANCSTYGGLYQWNEMMAYSILEGSQGICPNGWHLPIDAEWTTLTTFLGGVSIAGGKMKTTGTIEAGTGLWWEPNTGATNESGFNAIPRGYRGDGGTFYDMGYYAFFWSSAQFSLDLAWYRDLYYNNTNVITGSYYKNYGFSVRCLKD